MLRDFQRLLVKHLLKDFDFVTDPTHVKINALLTN